MAMDVLRTCLQDLETFARNLSSILSGADLVKSLSELCLSTETDEEKALCASMLFEEKRGVLDLVETMQPAQDRAYNATKKGLLDFLASYVTHTAGSRMSENAPDIWNRCFQIYRRDQSNTVKDAAFEPILSLLHLHLPSLSTTAIEIDTMIRVFLTDFKVTKTLSATVKGKILKTLGLLVEHYPDSFRGLSGRNPNARELHDACMATLEKQYKSQKRENPLIEGAISGLASCLLVFNYVTDDESRKRVWTLVWEGLCDESHRYDIFRASLRFLALHAPMFSTWLAEHHGKVLVLLVQKGCMATNVGVRDSAYPALEAFVKQLGTEITAGRRDVKSDKRIFANFMAYMLDMLEDHQGDHRKIGIPVRTFGFFAKPIRRYAGLGELKGLLGKLIQRMEQLFEIRIVGEFEDPTVHLSSFLESTSNLVSEVDDVDDPLISALVSMLGILFRNYRRLYDRRRWACHKPVVLLFAALYPKDGALRSLLSKFVFMALTFSISNTSNEESHTAPNAPACVEFCPLWSSLLCKKPGMAPLLSSEEQDAMHKIIFEEFMRSLIRLISLLDLRFTDEESSGTVLPSSDQDPPLSLVKKKDAELLLNLVEVCKELLPTTRADWFVEWLYVFGREVITRSNQHPLISGYYKLLTIALRMAEEVGHFRGLLWEGEEDEEDGMDVNPETEKRVTFSLFSKFIREVLARIHQYTDELLGACIQLVLSVPKEFLPFSALVPAFHATFKLGLSYLPLATMGLDALEYWIDEVPSAVEPILHQILPCLNQYLHTSGFSSEAGKAVRPTKKNMPTAAQRRRGKTHATGSVSEDPMEDIQFRILRILGHVGRHRVYIINSLHPEGTTEHQDVTVAWDTSKRVKFTMPFRDLNADIFLDPILPRIVDLALNSSSRQTKIAACELLHASVLLMIARGAKKRTDRQAEMEPMDKIYEHVFPALLQLAVDVEDVARKLFAPLLLQLIHWFTKSVSFEFAETMVLLDAIVDAAGHPSDGNLRVFACQCLAEFMVWSIRNISPKQEERDPTNVKSLIKRIASMAHHSSPYKRLGAALAFNGMHRTLREERTLVDRFALEILQDFVTSLRLAEQDEESIGSAEETTKAVHNIAKTIVNFASMLQGANRQRAMNWTLESAVDWLFQGCGRLETRCRQACMTLVSQLGAALDGSPKKWMERKIEAHGFAWVTQAFEAQMKEFRSVRSFNVQNAITFCQALEAGLDCYLWMLRDDIISSTTLFSNKASRLDSTLQQFVTTVARLCPRDSCFRSCTPSEVSRFQRFKCNVVKKLMVLEQFTLEKDLSLQLSSLRRRETFELLFLAILRPITLGFNRDDPLEMKKLSMLAHNLVKLFASRKPRDMEVGIQATLLSCEDQLGAFDIERCDLSLDEMVLIVQGCELLHEHGIFLPHLVTPPTELLSTFVATISNLQETVLLPTQRLMIAEMLDLCFILGMDTDTLFRLLLDSNMASSVHRDGSRNKGDVFYANFREKILLHLFKRPELVVRPLIGRMDDNLTAIRVILDALERLIRNFDEKRQFMSSFVREIMANLALLRSWCQSSAPLDRQAHGLEVCRRIMELDWQRILGSQGRARETLQEMYCHFLQRDTPAAMRLVALDNVYLFLHEGAQKEDKVVQCLSDIIVSEFPLRSTSLDPGSDAFRDFVSILRRLLAALEKSQSDFLLEDLLPSFAERTHVHRDALDKTLDVFATRAALLNPSRITDTCFRIYMDQRYPSDVRSAAIQQILCPVLRRMTSTPLLAFYQTRIIDMMRTLEKDLEKPGIRRREDEEDELVMRICTMNLLEVMFSRLPRELIYDEVGPKWGAPRGSPKLTQELMRRVNLSRIEKIPWETRCGEGLPKLRLELHQAAHNLMAEIVLKTQTQDRFFLLFFRENPEKECVWENLVDVETPYMFEVEVNLESISEMSKGLQEARAQSKRRRERSRYLASQYLADSSLNQEAPFMGSFFGESGSQEPDVGERIEPSNQNAEKDGADAEGEGDLDMEVTPPTVDDLSAHPCLSQLLRIVQFCAKNFKGANGVMPKWMELLHGRLSDPDAPLNVRLLLAKLVTSQPRYFEEFALEFFAPMANLLLDQTRGLGNPGIHSFAREVCMVFWTWEKLVPTGPEARSAGTSFLSFLISNAVHERTDILRENNEIIKHFMERWCTVVQVNKEAIFNLLCKGEASESTELKTYRRHRLEGLAFLAACLGNNGSAFHPALDTFTTEECFYQKLLANLDFPSSDVYQATGEVIGMVLDDLQSRHSSFLSTFELMVFPKVLAFSRDDARFLRIVGSICGRYPAFFDDGKIRANVLNLLPRLQGPYKAIALRILSSRAEEMDDLFDYLRPKLLDFLSYTDDSVQFRMLQLLRKMVGRMKKDHVDYFLPTLVGTFLPHRNTNCREETFALLMWLYSHPDACSATSQKLILRALLQGLADESDSVRESLFEFWNSRDRLPEEVIPRLKTILDNLYTPEIEERYVHFAARLLLDLTNHSADFEREMFDALEDCEFADYAIDTSWQRRSLPMTPMFTRPTLEPGSQAGTADMDDLGPGMVRATQAFQFTPTQTADGVGGGLGFTMELAGAMKGEGGNLPFATPVIRPSQIRERGDPTAERRAYHPRARFFKQGPGGSQSYYARRALQIKHEMAQAEARQKTARMNRIVLYRKYRQGDLPDVAIKYRDVIRPLQALTHHDGIVAREVFNSLLGGLLAVDPEADVSAREVSRSLESLLTRSSGSTLFTGCIFALSTNYGTLRVDPRVVAEAGERSLNFHGGILLLEKQLIQQPEDEKRLPKRSRKGAATVSSSTPDGDWYSLAQLYSSLGEREIVLGLVSRHLSKDPHTIAALSAQNMGDYAEAHRHYNSHFEERGEAEADTPEDKQCWAGNLECLSRMLNWDSVVDTIATDVRRDDSTLEPRHFWQLQEGKALNLKLFLHAGLRAQDSSKRQRTLDTVSQMERDPEQRRYLETYLADELCTAALMRDDYDRCRYYLSKAFRQFVSSWSSLHELATAARLHLLQSLQPLLELDEFTEFLTAHPHTLTAHSLRDLMGMWHGRLPHSTLDDIIVWDSVIQQRRAMAKKLVERHEMLSGSKIKSPEGQAEKKDIIALFKEERTFMYIRAAAAARRQRNLYVARQQYQNVLHEMGSSFEIRSFKELVKFYLARSMQDAALGRSETVVKALQRAFGVFEKHKAHPEIMADEDNLRTYWELKGDVYAFASKCMKDDPRVSFDGMPRDQLEVVAFEAFEKCAPRQDKEGSTKALMKFAVFCNDVLKECEESETTGRRPMFATPIRLAELVMVNIMSTMSRESSKARDYFPRVLELLARYPEIRSAFSTLVERIPCWMFLSWIAQILAVMDTPIGPLLTPILENLARHYPQAIYFPVVVSCSQLQPRGVSLLQRVQDLIASPLLESFVDALENLTAPEVLVKAFQDDARSALHRKDREQFRNVWRRYYHLLFGPENVHHGDYQREFARKFKKSFDQECGVNGEKLKDTKTINEAFSKSFKSRDARGRTTERLPPHPTGKDPLHRHSKWLAEYQDDPSSGIHIEVPGQYTGKGKPLPSTHIRIVSFDAVVLTLASKQRPRRLMIRGNDEREYPFLVKGAEDVRIDQRTEQLFGVMNDIMGRDANCARRRLRLKTFQVIPVTNNTGLVQWVHNTKPLKTILSDEDRKGLRTTRGKVTGKTSMQQAYERWESFLKGKLPANEALQTGWRYINERISREDMTSNFDKTKEMVRWDLLRTGILSLAAGPESYLAIRSQFARTIAIFNVCSYILGIGDRHPDNYLIDCKDGGVIGIDFGYSFGWGLLLPAPELVPFRLTRQITNFFKPLDHGALLVDNMVHCLNALRVNKDILMNVMDVFVKEPLLDWQKEAQRSAKDAGHVDPDGSNGTWEWFPNQKLEVVRMKLSGYNSAHVMAVELERSKRHHSLSKILEHVRGLPGQPRRDLPIHLSVEQQVECLIDHATDSNLLGRVWIGWSPYV